MIDQTATTLPAPTPKPARVPANVAKLARHVLGSGPGEYVIHYRIDERGRLHYWRAAALGKRVGGG